MFMNGMCTKTILLVAHSITYFLYFVSLLVFGAM